MTHAAILDRIHHGRSSVVIGGMPELPETMTVVRVRCELPGPLAPLERACKRIERLLDAHRSARHEVADEIVRPIRERFVVACNRLAAQAPAHAVLVLDRIEAADPPTHDFLAQLVREPAKLRLPLLLIVRREPPETFRAITDALEHPVPASSPLSGESFAADAVDRVLGLRPEPLHPTRAARCPTPAETTPGLGDRVDGIELNREKASPIGLAFDERAIASSVRSIFHPRGDVRERWIDVAAVVLFAGSMAFVAAHARGWFRTEGHDSAAIAPEDSYTARVMAALPHLERHVAAGSTRARGLVCDEVERLDEIAELEAAVGGGDDPAISVPLAEGIAALRACVACTPEPHGCAAAARAFTVVERRLALPRGASGI